MTEENDGSSFSQHRYWARIAKGCVLPLLYTIVSLFMLRNYVTTFSDRFDYEVTIILAGTALGLLTMTGLTVFNIVRARKDRKKGAKLETYVMISAFSPILIIVIVMALFMGLWTVWQFSIGFFATTLVPPVLVLILEQALKGQFFVREFERPAGSKSLVIVPTAQG